jgi:alpha-beta hydrolase superfamily lysophospholipase
VLIIARFSYRIFLYPAPQDAGDLTAFLPRSGSLKELRAKDGVPVHAVHIPAPPGAPTIVHFHGNGETIRNNIGLAAELARRGLGVLLVEYRGYGLSSGRTPSEEGLYMDAEAALDALASDGVSPSRTVLWGTSLGSGVAAEMAARGRGAALILVTPFTSIRAVATRIAPLLPASLYMGDHYDTLSKASAIRVPTLIIHGDRDELVPYSMGQALSAAIPGALLITIEGGRHNDLFVRAPDMLLDRIVVHSLGR